MVKKNTTMSIDDIVLATAKKKIENISQFTEDCLRGACGNDLNENVNEITVDAQISQLAGKLEQLKNMKKGIEEQKETDILMGRKKEEIIIIDD